MIPAPSGLSAIVDMYILNTSSQRVKDILAEGIRERKINNQIFSQRTCCVQVYYCLSYVYWQN